MNQQQPPYGQPPQAQPPGQAPYGQPQGYGQYPGQPNPGQPQPGNGMAIAAMVTGICSVALFFIPFLNIILGITGVALGIPGMKRGDQVGKGKGMAIAGIACGIVGILIGLWFTYQVFAAIDEVSRWENYNYE